MLWHIFASITRSIHCITLQVKSPTRFRNIHLNTLVVILIVLFFHRANELVCSVLKTDRHVVTVFILICPGYRAGLGLTVTDPVSHILSLRCCLVLLTTFAISFRPCYLFYLSVCLFAIMGLCMPLLATLQFIFLVHVKVK